MPSLRIPPTPNNNITYYTVRTHRTPTRSLSSPHTGHATSATSSSANPSVPTASPTEDFWWRRSVITKEMEALRKTRKEMLKRATNRRYVVIWRRVAVNGEVMNGIVSITVSMKHCMVVRFVKGSCFNVVPDSARVGTRHCRSIHQRCKPSRICQDPRVLCYVPSPITSSETS